MAALPSHSPPLWQEHAKPVPMPTGTADPKVTGQAPPTPGVKPVRGNSFPENL